MTGGKENLVDMRHDMLEFRHLRAAEAEIDYYKTRNEEFNHRRRNELYLELLRALGEKKQLLIEFADRDMSCFNPDTDYFYNRGFDDCLYFLKTLDRVGGRDFLIDRFLESAPKI